MKRAALYLRVSTVDQHPETQLYDLRQLAQQRSFQIVHEYYDKISGTKAKRPGLDQLLSDARRGQFDVVVVWAGDRIARSVRHYLEVLDEFSRLGIEFISFRENIDTGGALGRAIVVIIGAIAELEHNLIVERVRAGMRRAKLEGRHIGRKPLGHRRPTRFFGIGATGTEPWASFANTSTVSPVPVIAPVGPQRRCSKRGAVRSPLQLDENRQPKTAA